jgi:hypothetical protein
MSGETAISDNAAREKLRAERNLHPVSDAEEGAPIQLVSAGVYGFTYSPGTEAVPLYAKRTFQVFETHKLADGETHLIGFLKPSEAATLRAGVDFLDCNLYPDPYGEAQEMVSLPLRRVLKAKPASRESGNYVPLQIVPIRETR